MTEREITREVEVTEVKEETETFKICDNCAGEIDGDCVRYGCVEYLCNKRINYDKPLMHFCDEQCRDEALIGVTRPIETEPDRSDGKTTRVSKTPEIDCLPSPVTAIRNTVQRCMNRFSIMYLWIFTGFIPFVGLLVSFVSFCLSVVIEDEQMSYKFYYLGICIGTVQAIVSVSLVLISVA